MPIVQYGHGLLGGRGEVQAGYLAEMADRYGWIIFAMDWTGMKSSDAGYISLMLVEDLGDFAIVPERSLQGFTEFHVGLKLFQGPLVKDEHFTVADATTGERMPLLDPERVYYYGNSQGGILGGAYSAISNEIERAVLGVGGGPYHLLLTRSKDFDPFFTLFESMYPDPAEVGLWLGLLQTLWDEAEGAGYARAFSTDPIPGNPEKHVLQQVAIGDNQVTTLGAQFLARGHGAVLIDDAARAVWDIEQVSGATTNNVLVEYEYGIDEPYVNLPPSDPDPHEWPRRERSGQTRLRTSSRPAKPKASVRASAATRPAARSEAARAHRTPARCVALLPASPVAKTPSTRQFHGSRSPAGVPDPAPTPAPARLAPSSSPRPAPKAPDSAAAGPDIHTVFPPTSITPTDQLLLET